MPRPPPKTCTPERIGPFLADCAEATDIARACFKEYFDAAPGRVAVSTAENDFARGLYDDFGGVGGLSSVMRRAALLRIAARAHLLLALDELKRGEVAITEDMARIDELGRVKR